MLLYKDATSLASLFHLNSEPWDNIAAYDDPHSHRVEFKSVRPGEEAITLPSAEDSFLTRLIRARTSCREFAGQDIDTQHLANVLDAAYGVTGFREFPGGIRTFGRSVPSAGGLYPLELYVLAEHVSGLAKGLYHFHARDRALEPLSADLSLEELLPSLMHQTYLEGASALIFLSAVFARTQRKYGPRGYRYILLEAGHAAQNICLRAVELNLTTLCLGGYVDSRINAILELDGIAEGVVYVVALGHPK